MFRRSPWMAVLALPLWIALPAGAQPGVSVQVIQGDTDSSVFYQSLAPYGEWVQVEPYGWVWSPYNVAPEWRPYQLGHWAATEFGWTWVSSEPFGWATYHYGRWIYHPYQGWVWLPGTQWGPAWVAWRRGDGWVGWAPLPPDAQAEGIAIKLGRFQFELSHLKRFSWCFVEERRLCEPVLTSYIARLPRNVSIYNATQNVTNYTVVNNRVINESVNIAVIEKRIGRPVPRYRVLDVSGPALSRGVVKGNVLQFYRPRVTHPALKPPTAFVPVPARSAAPGPDVKLRFASDQSALEARFAADRVALEQRQKIERARMQANMKADEIARRHTAERAALDEQMQRERNLLTRYQDRVSKGQIGPTRASGSKFSVVAPKPVPLTPKATKPPEQPKKK